MGQFADSMGKLKNELEMGGVHGGWTQPAMPLTHDHGTPQPGQLTVPLPPCPCLKSHGQSQNRQNLVSCGLP